MMLRRILREPLLHFTLAALVIFAAYGVLTPYESPRGEVVVTAPKIEQLAAVFAKTWQRPPSPRELKGLIDGYVKEEIDVQEALALGLDQGDAVIRRRLQQKIEFMTDAGTDAVKPTDGELQSYLDAHPAKFKIAAQTGFQQIFLNSDQRGQRVDAEATSILAKLQADPALEPVAFGDASLLPAEMPLTDISSIGETFGPEFAAAVRAAPPGAWIGPVASSFGLHLVRVSEHTSGRMPALGEVRDLVLREFANDRRQAIEDERLNMLLKRYRVVIQAPEADANP
ncbi:peptidyl-prolyl cis-trans isomerase [Rhizobium leguminosarum]|uniref:peptidylprolyl isomerase n=1 Tax=Rhizobium leguminosarum TaxID=384 RepID=UPI001FDF1F74|nr:peptidylprolyl isomerase [Rhizobium leguminosarum]